MRGHIVKRGKNSYSLAISMGKDTNTGKYKYHWETVKGTKKDAEKRLSELLHQLDTGRFMKPSKTTLGEYLGRWLKDYAMPNLAPKTTEGYEHIISRHINPSLGNIAMAQLKPEHLQRYYSEKINSGRCKGVGGISAQTVRHHHTVLHKALQTAVEWMLLPSNVADAVRPPRVQRPEMQTWGEDEITRFLESAKNSPYYVLFYIALFTGMRRSELLASRWLDIDFVFGQIYVSRSLHVLKDGKVVFRSPKTASARRTVALPPSAILLLKEHKEKQALERAMQGISLSDDDLVFSHLDGKPLLPNTITHAWIKLVRRTGLKSIRFHDARHTHASLMLKQGTHPKIVQERLGHASIQITLDTYSHIAPGLQEAAANRFDEAFSNRYNKRENEVIENHY
jgi:integrase